MWTTGLQLGLLTIPWGPCNFISGSWSIKYSFSTEHRSKARIVSETSSKHNGTQAILIYIMFSKGASIGIHSKCPNCNYIFLHILQTNTLLCPLGQWPQVHKQLQCCSNKDRQGQRERHREVGGGRRRGGSASLSDRDYQGVMLCKDKWQCVEGAFSGGCSPLKMLRQLEAFTSLLK